MHYKIDPKTNVCTLCTELVPELPDPAWFAGVVDAVGPSGVTLRFDGDSVPPVVGQKVLVMATGQRNTLKDGAPRPKERTRREKIYDALDFLSTAGMSRVR
jgi:hypothetical protein